MNTSVTCEISDKDVVQFFQGLKNELRFESTRKIISLVQTILSKLRGSYTAQQIAEIIIKTPPMFHLVFLGQSHAEDEKKVIHLDELVDNLIQDEGANNELFKSEIETLGIVIVVLQRVQRLFRYADINALNYTLSHELQQAVQEEI